MSTEHNEHAPTAQATAPQAISLPLKAIHVFARGLIYALCFWSAYGLLYRPFFYATANGTPTDAVKQQREQVQAYQEQMDRSSKMLIESEQQQKRMAAILTKQEEITDRWAKVITVFEKQSAAKK